MNEKWYTTYQNLGNAGKPILREQLITINTSRDKKIWNKQSTIKELRKRTNISQG